MSKPTPGYPGRPLPRPRAISQPDAEVPESVFVALQGVQQAVSNLSQEVRTAKADTDARLATQDKVLAELKAGSADRWFNLFKVALPSVLAIVGGTVGLQKATADKPPPPEIRAVRSAADLALDECRPLRVGTYERAECFERVSRADGQPR
jgi:hypothetical protein